MSLSFILEHHPSSSNSSRTDVVWRNQSPPILPKDNKESSYPRLFSGTGWMNQWTSNSATGEASKTIPPSVVGGLSFPPSPTPSASYHGIYYFLPSDSE